MEITETKDSRLLADLNKTVQDWHFDHFPKVYKPHENTGISRWFEEVLESGNAKAFIAHKHQKAAGYVLLFFRIIKDNPFVHDQAILHIDQMAVHPDFQNQGIGMALLHHVKEEADRLGIKKITLDVSVENHTAFALYSKAGFTPTRQVMEWNL